VIFLEPKSRYWQKGDVDTSARQAPMEKAVVVREGTDVTLIGHGAIVSMLLQVADVASDEGTSIEVIDLRSVSPIDWDTLVASAQSTGRVVVAQEAPGNVSVGSEIAATLAERTFYTLEAPVVRVSGFDTPFPPAQLESSYLPSVDRILDAIDRVMAY
jgi:2-oxoisovalerate dehydrogenase E1 component beta subunit